VRRELLILRWRELLISPSRERHAACRRTTRARRRRLGEISSGAARGERACGERARAQARRARGAPSAHGHAQRAPPPTQRQLRQLRARGGAGAQPRRRRANRLPRPPRPLRVGARSQGAPGDEVAPCAHGRACRVPPACPRSVRRQRRA